MGIIVSRHKTHAFMESWFIKLNQKIFLSDWFCDFMADITKSKTKADITIKYEHGLSNLITNNNCSWGGLYTVWGAKHTINRNNYSKTGALLSRKCLLPDTMVHLVGK